MKIENSLYRAFRLYGEFLWPPTPNPPVNADTQAGVVEIYFTCGNDEITGNLIQGTYLRWIPKRLFDEHKNHKLHSQLANIYELTDEELRDRFVTQPDQEQVFAIHKPDSILDKDLIKRGTVLSFAGAYLIDQFDLDAEVISDIDRKVVVKPSDLRWPLVREYEYSERGSFFSTVNFGALRHEKRNIASFSLNLALATPIPHTRYKGFEQMFIRFALYYDCVVPDLDIPPPEYDVPVGSGSTLEAHKFILFARADPEDDPGKESDQTKILIKQSDALIKSGNNILGKFHIAKSTNDIKDPAEGYIEYDPHSLEPSEKFWPVNNNIFFGYLLKSMGFRITNDDPDRVVINSLNARELSLRFSEKPRSSEEFSFAGKSGFSRLTYRLSLHIERNFGTRPGGDLQLAGNSYTLKLHEELNSNVHIQQRDVYVDVEITNLIEDSEVWEWYSQAWVPKLNARVIWDFDADKEQLGAGSPIKKARSGAAHLTSRWDINEVLSDAFRTMRMARLDLQQLESAQPQSFLPEWMVYDRAGAAQIVQVGLFASFPVKYNTKRVVESEVRTGTLKWGSRVDPSTRQIHPFRLSLVDAADLVPNERALGPGLVFRTWLPSFAFGPVRSRNHYHFELAHDPQAIENSDNLHFAYFKIEHQKDEPDHLRDSPGFTGHLGSLLFVRGGKKLTLAISGRDYSYLRLKRRLPLSGTEVKDALPLSADSIRNKYYGTINLTLRLRLLVDQIVPYTVDVPKGNRRVRPQPLMIDIGPTTKSSTGDGRFILEVTESLSGQSDRHLRANIVDNETAVGLRQQVLLSQQPFSLFKFSIKPLRDRGDDQSSSVAIFDSDTRQWEFRVVSDVYRYVLPPQVVGESMDKPRRLEIHDYEVPSPEKTADSDSDSPLTELVNWRPVNKAVLSELKRHAVEFKLTPSSELWIRPSDVERGYFLPEWSSYEIFRQTGVNGLGAALTAFRGEFLYGLPVGIDVSKEQGLAKSTRVAEIEALTGHWVAGPLTADAYPALTQRWSRLSETLARRSERFEFWNNDPTSPVPFAPSRFKSGVSFAHRSTALHRLPIDLNPEAPEADHGGAPSVHSNTFRTHRAGLSGGALWPIESANLFKILAENPHSDGGSIENIALTPLGGDADQSARFLNGQVTIISETRGGFVHRQKVEVIGRIGACWHRAKHVVVYERTVNPSAQFAPELVDKSTKPVGLGSRTRRTVLRKVREYCELLEPARSYPDFAAANPRMTGFLRAVNFNSNIINVDSAWSEDVGDYGWRIPLWNRHSARLRPQVYPMPDVGFVCAAEGAEVDPLQTQECLNPENLYFFADFSAGTDDTNSWPARVGVDFANLPAAGNVDEKRYKVQQIPSGSLQKNVSRLPLGYRRFNWRLAPATLKTKINAHRGNKPVYVGLESVSFMRARPLSSASQSTTNVQKYLDEIIPIDDKKEPIDGLTELKDFRSWLPGDTNSVDDLPQQLQEFAKAYEALRTAVDAASKDRIEAALKSIKAATQTENPIFPYLDRINTRIKSLGVNKLDGIPKIDDVLTGGVSNCDRITRDIAGAIRRKKLLVIESIRSWESHLDNEITDWTKPRPFPSKDLLLKKIVDEVVKEIQPIFQEMGSDVGNVKSGVETARNIVLDFRADVEDQLRRTIARVEKFNQTYDKTKPWSTSRLRQFEASLSDLMTNSYTNIESALTDARQRFGVELDELTQSVGTTAAKYLADTVEDASGALGGVRLLRNGFRRVLEDRLEEMVERLVSARTALIGNPNAANAVAAIDTALGEINSITTEVKRLNTLIANGELSVKEIFEQLANQAELVVNAFLTLSTELNQFADNATDDAVEALLRDYATLTESMQQVLNQRVGTLKKMALDMDSTPENTPDKMVAMVSAILTQAIQESSHLTARAFSAIDVTAGDITAALATLEKKLSPTDPEGFLESVVRPAVIVPAVNSVLESVTVKPTMTGDEIKRLKGQLKILLQNLSAEVSANLEKVSDAALGVNAEVAAVCAAIAGGIDDIKAYFDEVKEYAGNYLTETFNAELKQINDLINDINDLATLKAKFESADRELRSLVNDAARSIERVETYVDRVFDEAGNVTSGGLLAAPNNLLRLYSAATSAPEIAQLEANIDRMRARFDELSDIIETTEVEAFFARLGDQLKAMGINLPFNKIGDEIQAMDLSQFDISGIFENFGGINFDELLGGYRLPEGANDAVRLTHDFDEKSLRAWVRLDIDLPLPGRRSLFKVGPFTLDFVDTHLMGFVKYEASKDNDKVQETGFATIGTTIDAVVGGQSMVTLRQVAINYTREKGLKVDFDPKNIKLNPNFKFIQDTLGSIFGDEVGGINLIKHNGIPVGVEHLFSIPPISLMYGTSGVSNLQIANRFQLRAFPDFVLANRFNLSNPEVPFIFSIFIIGGTGYIQVDANYRPFTNELEVIVEAGVGGSASLGFAFGPVSGSVFVALSVVLRYQKLIGSPGGGLTVSLALLIAGNVDVAGLVSVYIGLYLTMSYQSNGQIDANGRLVLTIKISRFFKFKVKTSVKYKLRNGQSQTITNTTTDTEIDKEALEARLKEEVGALGDARE